MRKSLGAYSSPKQPSMQATTTKASINTEATNPVSPISPSKPHQEKNPNEDYFNIQLTKLCKDMKTMMTLFDIRVELVETALSRVSETLNFRLDALSAEVKTLGERKRRPSTLGDAGSPQRIVSVNAAGGIDIEAVKDEMVTEIEDRLGESEDRQGEVNEKVSREVEALKMSVGPLKEEVERLRSDHSKILKFEKQLTQQFPQLSDDAKPTHTISRSPAKDFQFTSMNLTGLNGDAKQFTQGQTGGLNQFQGLQHTRLGSVENAGIGSGSGMGYSSGTLSFPRQPVPTSFPSYSNLSGTLANMNCGGTLNNTGVPMNLPMTTGTLNSYNANAFPSTPQFSPGTLPYMLQPSLNSTNSMYSNNNFNTNTNTNTNVNNNIPTSTVGSGLTLHGNSSHGGNPPRRLSLQSTLPSDGSSSATTTTTIPTGTTTTTGKPRSKSAITTKKQLKPGNGDPFEVVDYGAVGREEAPLLRSS